jgi:hypothetical protein
MNFPQHLRINAWTGDEAAEGNVSENAQIWAIRSGPPTTQQYLWPSTADPRDWKNPKVGWGLILPERPGLSPAQLATADDAPEPIRALHKQRGGPVLRYSLDPKRRLRFLRNYASKKDIAISGAPYGLGKDALPRYLLIYGSPAEVPWELQYVLSTTRCVGRLDLEGAALERYVTALGKEWGDSQANLDRVVAWSVDKGAPDITRLMRNALAKPIYDDLNSDPDLHDKGAFIDGSVTPATVVGLCDALADRRPALIITTSHGKTGPLNNLDMMRAGLGLLVDAQSQTLDPASLLQTWQPDGAIWYAHACCSAGSDASTIFEGLVKPGSPVDRVLKGVAGLGAMVAPLPRALLGAQRPLRAFIGHVEPTFDWTIQQPQTGQFLTDNIKQAHKRLYERRPVGLAFEECYRPIGSLASQESLANLFSKALGEYNRGADTSSSMLYFRLAARDLQSMVILGDPTAMLPIPQ